MSQEEARELCVWMTEGAVFFSCTPGERGGNFTLRMEGKLSVQIAAPGDKIACMLGKQKFRPPRIQNWPRLPWHPLQGSLQQPHRDGVVITNSQRNIPINIQLLLGIDISKMSNKLSLTHISPLNNNNMASIQGQKWPLWELWDPVTYAKRPGRRLSHLCIA